MYLQYVVDIDQWIGDENFMLIQNAFGNKASAYDVRIVGHGVFSDYAYATEKRKKSSSNQNHACEVISVYYATRMLTYPQVSHLQ
jgi:hypothetical protein